MVCPVIGIIGGSTQISRAARHSTWLTRVAVVVVVVVVAAIIEHSCDCRSGYYRKPRHEAHPLDCSVMTYRGHHVLSTLIRCHFSPVESTGGQYVYTGGSNGIIWIYHLDGRVVQGESHAP